MVSLLLRLKDDDFVMTAEEVVAFGSSLLASMFLNVSSALILLLAKVVPVSGALVSSGICCLVLVSAGVGGSALGVRTYLLRTEASDAIMGLTSSLLRFAISLRTSKVCRASLLRLLMSLSTFSVLIEVLEGAEGFEL